MATCTYNCLMNVINIGNSIIGVSLLAMPYCFRKCGIFLSLVLIFISAILTKTACYLILKSAVMARRRSFEFLAFHIFGSYGKLFVEMGVIGFLIGVCIAFFVVIGDLGPPLASEFLNIENTPNLRTDVLMLVGLCVALPLGLLRKIDSLTSLSALSIAFYVCLILKIFAEAVPNLAENEWWYEVNWWQSDGILPCLPIFSMALSCQTQLFEFFDTSTESSLKRMQSVIDGAILLCCVFYALVGVFGYIAFHDKGGITGNILVLLTPSVVTEFIKFGFLMTVAVSFPLCLFPCRSSLHSLLFKQGFVHHDLNVNTIPDHRFRILTVSLVIVTIGVAIMLPNIEFVLGIIGSTIGTLICLILPAMIFIYDSNKMTSDKRKAQILLGVGVFILIACTISTLQENSQRPATVVPVEMAQKMTPSPVLILSSPALPAIQSPKIILKENPVLPAEKKFEVSELKVEDQKRLEPPIPQEPEVKADKNADLDPQAIQKEDKELQKEVRPPPPSVAPPPPSPKKEDGLDKQQEKVLKELKNQQQEQKKILEEQKMILEQLKQHKESHEEMKRIEKLEQRGKDNDVAQEDPKPNDVINIKREKIVPSPQTVSVVKDIPQKHADNLKISKQNSSIHPVSRQKIPAEEIPRVDNKKELVSSVDLLVPKDVPVVVKSAPNETAYKNSVRNSPVNVSSDGVVGKDNNKTLNVHLDVPSVPSPSKNSVSGVKDRVIGEDSELRVKRRETLAKEGEFDRTVSLQNIETDAVIKNSNAGS